MNVSILVNPIHTYEEPWSPDSVMLGGTEDSVVRWASGLKQKGHETFVYYDGVPGEWEGVNYLPREQYKPRGVTLNVKSLDIEKQEPTAYLTNETDLGEKEVSQFEAVILPSRWARDNLHCSHPNQIVLPHGYDSEKIKPGPKIPKQVLYCSSPDRGLSFLLQAWPSIVKYHPNATLVVTYGFENKQHRNIPNLLALGSVDDGTMVELYNSSDIWTHPCSGGELYCMAGIKAQAAGAVPVYFPTMALQETVRHGISTTPEAYVGDMVQILGNEERKDHIRSLLAAEHYPDWTDSTDQLEVILRDIAQK